MGINILSRNSFGKTGDNYEKLKKSPQDPDPSKFILENVVEYNGNAAVQIKYPNCTNYEGTKIIVYKNVNYKQLASLKEIDPHFVEGNVIKPFARFEPTEEGWYAAINLLRRI